MCLLDFKCSLIRILYREMWARYVTRGLRLGAEFPRDISGIAVFFLEYIPIVGVGKRGAY